MTEREPAVPLGEAFERALIYASSVHALQVRKGTRVPYVSHLLAVAGLVMEDGGSETEVIGALLHDAAEDQGGEPRLEDIRRRFGDEVAAIVEGSSDTFETPKPPWEERKRAYLSKLPHERESVLRVTLADKLHNSTTMLRDLWMDEGGTFWDRFNAGRDSQLWYLEELATIFEERLPHSGLTRQFRWVIDELKAASHS
jgi:(p)ppGpp synthase/HD superfamily hydrolase